MTNQRTLGASYGVATGGFWKAGVWPNSEARGV